MDDTKWITDLARHWPTLAGVVPILLIAYYFVKFLATAYEPVARIFGRVGRKWRASAERKQRLTAGELGLLRDEVASLSRKVYELERRDAIYWEYVMYDQEWHREVQVQAVEQNWNVKRHLSFLEFRAKWNRENPDNIAEEGPF